MNFLIFHSFVLNHIVEAGRGTYPLHWPRIGIQRSLTALGDAGSGYQTTRLGMIWLSLPLSPYSPPQSYGPRRTDVVLRGNSEPAVGSMGRRGKVACRRASR